MSYIDRNLLPDEQIIFRTKKHLILFLYPMIAAIFAIFAVNYMWTNPLLIKVIWVPILIAVVFWAYVAIEYFSSEFGVTNKRVMMREGFFNRHANETRLNAISQVNIDQNPLGQLLNYGTVTINAFGVSDVFTTLAQPEKFQRAVNALMDKLVK